MDDSRDLRVLVVGRSGSGKSLLIKHLAKPSTSGDVPLSSQASLPATPRPSTTPRTPRPSRRPRRPPRDITGGIATRPSTLYLVRTWRALWSRLSRRWQRMRRKRDDPCSISRIEVRESFGEPRHWLVYDVQEDGLASTAKSFLPDLVLYVLRLDESRAVHSDRIGLKLLEITFGERVWSRTLVVLTRGHSLPPGSLTYSEFIRGRRDAIWRLVTCVRPPVPILEDGQPLVRVLTLTDIDPEGNDDYGELDLEDEHRITVYDDPPALPIVVVELSDCCPVNEDGDAVLPDGSSWMTQLGAGVQGVLSRQCAEEEPEDTCGMYVDPETAEASNSLIWKRWREHGFLIFLCQLVGTSLVAVLLALSASRWDRYVAYRRSRRSDVVLRLSDKEFERLTVQDIKPNPRLDELRDELEGADTLFFGEDPRLDNAGRDEGDEGSAPKP